MVRALGNLRISRLVEPSLHILIWSTLFLFIWHTVYTIGPFRRLDGSIYLPLMWSTGWSMILFYINALYLIPRFIYEKKYKQYIFWVILLYSVIVLANTIMDQLYSISLFSTEKEPFISDIIMNIKSKTVIISLSIGYGLTKQWIQNQEMQQQLVEDKLSTQLKYLKAQINPHFLFNTLNMAYASAVKSNDEATADIIEKISGFMRYVLYESNEDRVLLSKELEYIDNYIKLQLQRLSPEILAEVKYEVTGNPKNLRIAPMILIPFIENIFKHGVMLTQKPEMVILIEIRPESILLVTRNLKKTKTGPTDIANSGIGMKNTSERLQLIYPGHHNLNINNGDKFFEVTLEIQLNSNVT